MPGDGPQTITRPESITSYQAHSPTAALQDKAATTGVPPGRISEVLEGPGAMQTETGADWVAAQEAAEGEGELGWLTGNTTARRLITAGSMWDNKTQPCRRGGHRGGL